LNVTGGYETAVSARTMISWIWSSVSLVNYSEKKFSLKVIQI